MSVNSSVFVLVQDLRRLARTSTFHFWCRYLDLFFVSDRMFKCNFDHSKSRLFKAFNDVYGKVGRLVSGEVVLSTF